MQSRLGAPKKTSATVLGRALQTNGGIVPPEGATFILNLGIRDDDKKRASSCSRSNKRVGSPPTSSRNSRRTFRQITRSQF